MKNRREGNTHELIRKGMEGIIDWTWDGIRIDLHVGYRGVMIAVRLNVAIEYLQTNLMPVSWLVAEHDFIDSNHCIWEI